MNLEALLQALIMIGKLFSDQEALQNSTYVRIHFKANDTLR